MPTELKHRPPSMLMRSVTTSRNSVLPAFIKWFSALLLLIGIGCLASCGGSSTASSTTPPASSNNPVPSIASLTPSSNVAGGATFTLTVNGSGFTATSSAQWNGQTRATTFVSSTQVTASITASDIASAGTANVTIANPAPGGGTSSAATFTVNPASVPVQYPLVQDMGAIRQNSTVEGRDGTFSANIDGMSYWAFNDTAMTTANAEGKNFISNSLAWTDSLDASGGIFLNHDHLDSTGHITEYVRLSDEEVQFNAQHDTNNCTATPATTCGEAYAVWPGPIVPVIGTDTIYQFYGIVLRGGDITGFQTVGGGIATWSKSSGAVTLVANAAPGTAHPTLIWQKSVQYTGGAVIDGSYIYSLGCGVGYLVMNCSIARAPVASATAQSSWTYYAGNNTWSTDESAAATLFQGGAAGNSISYNTALGKYLVVYSPPFSSNVYYITAPQLWGPWSNPTELFTGVASTNGAADYAAMAHPEFAEQNGNVQYITYVRDTGALNQEVRLVKVTFAAPTP